MPEIKIKHRITGEVLRKGDLATIAELVSEWIDEFRAKGQIADLRYANLNSADLRYANLRYADLSSADLRRSNLSSADLSFANLRSADLRSADLRFADLRSADLSFANLRYADLSSADLRRANLHDLGQDSRGYRFFLYFEPEPIIRAGCRKFTIADAEEHWGAAHEDEPLLRAEILGKLAAAKMIIAAREAMNPAESEVN